MARLPVVRGDLNNWGTVLNEFLRVQHGTDGALNAYALDDLPAPGTAGRLARVTDDVRGIFMDNGRVWRQEIGTVVNLADLATGGAGTVASPFTGWESAFSALAANTTVMVPIAEFRATTTLTINVSGRRMFGHGPGSIIRYTAASGNLLTIGDGVTTRLNNVIANVFLKDDDYANSGAGWAIDLTTAPRTFIHNVTVDWGSTGAATGAIRLDNSFGTQISNFWISGIRGQGVRVQNSSGFVTITKGIIEGQSTANGVLISLNNRGAVVDGVVLETAAVGVDLLSGGPYSIRAYFENFGTNSIRGTLSSGFVGGLIISGSEFQDSQAVSVDLSPTGGSTILAAQISNNHWLNAHVTAALRFNTGVAGILGPNRFDNDTTTAYVGTPGNSLLISDPDNIVTGAQLAAAFPLSLPRAQNSLTTGTIVSLFPDNSHFIELRIRVTGTNQWARFLLNADNNNTTELEDPSGVFSVTKGTASSTNIYWDATNLRYELENNTGGTRSYRLVYLRLP